MDKCDKCESMARVTVTGYLLVRYLCVLSARELCGTAEDQAAPDKFRHFLSGVRVSGREGY